MLTRRHMLLLLALTVVWGLNWPVMKLGVTHFSPLSFRTLSLWLSLPILWAVVKQQGLSLRVARQDWPELVRLSVVNMVLWHALIILALPHLSSGRAALLGYTMPVFSALIGALFYRQHIAWRGWLGVASAATGVLLLLWHEASRLAGAPAAVLLALGAACAWALGTQMLRRSTLALPTLSLAFWMTTLTTLVMSALSWTFERNLWQMPNASTWFAVLYNAVLVFGFAHVTWFWLARSLPPLASTLSIMLIPVVGVFSGAWSLSEPLHWQDGVAVLLMCASIASVMLGLRNPAQDAGRVC